MSCKVSKLNVCYLVDETFTPIKLNFSVDVSQDELIYKVYRYTELESEEQVTDIIQVPQSLKVGQYYHELIWTRNGIKMVVFQGNIDVIKKGADKCSCTSDKDVIINVDEYTVDIVFPKGEQGDKGLNAYEVAVINGFDGTAEDWLFSLKGEKGEKGEKGGVANVEGNLISSDTISINTSTKEISAVTIKNYKGGVGKVADAEDLRILKESTNYLFRKSNNLINTRGNLIAGSWRADGTFSNSLNWLSLKQMPVLPNTQYTLSGAGVVGTSSNRICFLNSSEGVISQHNGILNTFTTPEGCYFIKLTVASGTGVGNDLDNSLYHNTLMLNLGATSLPWEPYGDVLKDEKLNTIYVDGVNGNDNFKGTESNPVKTFERAVQLSNDNNNTVIVKHGDYYNIDFSRLFSFNNIIVKSGEVVRFIYGNVINKDNYVDGYNNVQVFDYVHSGTWVSNLNLWQLDIVDESTLIDINDRHVLHAGKTHRMNHTRLKYVNSIQEVSDSLTPCYYYDVSSNKMYFKKVNNSDLNSNPIILPYRGTSPVINKKVFYSNFQILFRALVCSGLKGSINSVDIGGVNSEGCFRTSNSVDLTFNNCRAYGSSNDGFNGAGSVFQNNNFANINRVVFNNCWAHDNFDDGESHHGYCEIYWNGGLTEFNGAGNTPASGAHAMYTNSVSQRNNDTGYSSQGSSTDKGVSTNMFVSNCLSLYNSRNYVLFGADSTVLNSFSIKPKIAHVAGSSLAKKYNLTEIS